MSSVPWGIILILLGAVALATLSKRSRRWGQTTSQQRTSMLWRLWRSVQPEKIDDSTRAEKRRALYEVIMWHSLIVLLIIACFSTIDGLWDVIAAHMTTITFIFVVAVVLWFIIIHIIGEETSLKDARRAGKWTTGFFVVTILSRFIIPEATEFFLAHLNWCIAVVVLIYLTTITGLWGKIRIGNGTRRSSPSSGGFLQKYTGLLLIIGLAFLIFRDEISGLWSVAETTGWHAFSQATQSQPPDIRLPHLSRSGKDFLKVSEGDGKVGSDTLRHNDTIKLSTDDQALEVRMLSVPEGREKEMSWVITGPMRSAYWPVKGDGDKDTYTVFACDSTSILRFDASNHPTYDGWIRIEPCGNEPIGFTFMSDQNTKGKLLVCSTNRTDEACQ